MPSAEQNPTPHSRAESYVGLLAKAGTVMVGGLYAVGLVLLCAYDAKYGIVEFNFLRARIFLVGFTFSVLCTLPAAAKHYGLAYFGPLKSLVEDSTTTFRHQRKIVLGAGFVYTALILAAPFNLFLFVFKPESGSARFWSWEEFGLGLGSYLVLVLSYQFIGVVFTRHPSRAATIAVLGSASFLGILYLAAYLSGSENQTNLANLVLFFMGVSAISEDAVSERSLLKWLLDFRNLLSIVALLAFYIVTLFGSIYPSLGGGAPQAIVIYLNRPVGWFNSGEADTLLLDETEKGLYVVQSPKEKALFIPGDSIAAVYFGPATDLTKRSK